MSFIPFKGSSNTLFHELKVTEDFTDYIVNPRSGKTDRKISQMKVANWMRGILQPITYAGEIYVYDDVLMKYVPEMRHLETLAVIGYEKTGHGIPNESTIRTLRRVTAETNFVEYPFNKNNDLINVLNGTVRLTLDGPRLEPHSPIHLFDYCIGTPFNPVWIGGTPEFDKYANEWGIRDALITIGGLALTQSLLKHTWKTAFMFEGPPNGGKTTALELIHKTFAGCTSTVDLTSLSDDKFSLSSIDTNLLNVADETPAIGPSKVDHFKNVVGSVHHHVEYKYLQPKPSVITAVHVFACNDLPEVRGGDSAFWDRWHVEECKNHFEVNPRVKDEIHSRKVREQYLYRSIEKAMDIIRNGWRNPQTGDEVQDLWMARNIGATRFLSESFDHGDGNDSLSLAEIYEQYCAWCKVQDPPKPTVSDRKISSMLLDMSYTRYLANGVTRFRCIVRK